ncbi:MAG: hypothetical protein Tsb0015_03890 [Simkaniaceae bacterium]
MSKEKYLIEDEILSIMDEKLGLNIQEPFDMPMLPEEITEGILLEERKGLILQRDEEGFIKKIYFEDKKRRRHGEYREYFEGMKGLFHRAFFYRGDLHGPSEFYAYDGRQLSKTWFVHGKEQGKAKLFYKSGKIYALKQYRNGLLHGMQEYFYENGSLKTKLEYENGILINQAALFWANGNLKRSGFYKQGIKEGKEQIFTEDGVLIDEGSYENGRPTGVHRRWTKHGILIEEKIYYHPLAFDWKKWDEKGSLIYERKWKNQKHVTEKVRVRNGEIKREGIWKEGQIHWKDENA